ncbi:unnamed protein product [Phaedon cochleariae]|uniref:Regulatory protein zeste n=1 Tax=Phaedon cochleariae TaxID=80249 RepID=A0A9N9SA72_PHACE|nr:unnamed protein product [Phaedon cochleariae]
MATGRFSGPNGREMNKKLWLRLSQELNSLGLGERTPEKWQRSWTDFKYLLKKKAGTIQVDIFKTGGGPSDTSPLSNFEQRALKILGESFYKGTGCSEVAVSNIVQREQSIVGEPLDQPSTSAGPQARPIKTHPLKIPHEYVGVDHDYSVQPANKKRKTLQDEAYAETISVLKDIKNVVNQGLDKISDSIDRLTEAILKPNK